MKPIVILILLSALAVPVSAETLNDYLTEAAANNPQLEAVYNLWQASAAQIDQQSALPDPMISYAYYFDEVETRVGPQQHKFGLAQKFPAFGKRSLKKKAATDSAAAAGEQYRRARLNLNAQVTRAYSELWFLQRSIDITTARRQLMTDLEQVARTQYKTGQPLAPVTQAQMELARLEERLFSLEDQRAPLTARLNALLNRPADQPLSLPAPLPYQPVEPDREQLLAELSQTSPELSGLNYTARSAAYGEKLARRDNWPDLTLGVQYIDTDDAIMPTSDSGKDPLIGTVSINLPLWPGKNSARIREAAYRKNAAWLTLEGRQRSLEADIKKSLFKLRDAERQIGLYQNGLIPKAEQTLAVTQQDYESGRLEFLNLIDAQRQLLEFELNLARARADHLNARAELSKQTGLDFLTGENHEAD